jgi:hypothetical protein
LTIRFSFSLAVPGRSITPPVGTGEFTAPAGYLGLGRLVELGRRSGLLLALEVLGDRVPELARDGPMIAVGELVQLLECPRVDRAPGVTLLDFR